MQEKGTEPPDSPPPPYPGYPTNVQHNADQPYYPTPSSGVYTNQPGPYAAQQPAYPQPYPQYQKYPQPHPGSHLTSPGHVIIAQPQHVTRGVLESRPPKSYLALSIVTCLCFSPLFGIIALCFSAASQSAYENGDVLSAKRHGTTALLLCILGIVLSLVILVIFLTAGVRY